MYSELLQGGALMEGAEDGPPAYSARPSSGGFRLPVVGYHHQVRELILVVNTGTVISEYAHYCTSDDHVVANVKISRQLSVRAHYTEVRVERSSAL